MYVFVGIVSTFSCYFPIISQSFGREIASSQDIDYYCNMIDNPIIIKGIKEYQKVKNKQREYINEKFVGYKIRLMTSLAENFVGLLK